MEFPDGWEGVLEVIPCVGDQNYTFRLCAIYNVAHNFVLFCAEVGISCTKLFLIQLPRFLSGYD